MRGVTIAAGRLAAEMGKLQKRIGADGAGLVFLCVGSDRSTGDAFGPLVGSLLQEAGYPHVLGTLAEPCDSDNLLERVAGLPSGLPVLAIDCCVGTAVGCYQLHPGPLSPGKFMGKPLPRVGDASLLAVVCRNTDNPYRALQSASLHLVMGMARQAATAIKTAFPLSAK
jgi:putative sporulation protein YyaC